MVSLRLIINQQADLCNLLCAEIDIEYAILVRETHGNRLVAKSGADPKSAAMRPVGYNGEGHEVWIDNANLEHANLLVAEVESAKAAFHF